MSKEPTGMMFDKSVIQALCRGALEEIEKARKLNIEKYENYWKNREEEIIGFWFFKRKRGYITPDKNWDGNWLSVLKYEDLQYASLIFSSSHNRIEKISNMVNENTHTDEMFMSPDDYDILFYDYVQHVKDKKIVHC